MNEIISEIARTENTTEPLKKLEQMILAEHDRIAERFKKN
jgi:hypothetical protein